jgi:putative addiction module CopG family antidote
MQSNRQFNITLEQDIAEAVERKVEAGAYASVSDVVSDGVRALIERDAEIERWLREEVIPGHAEYLANPSSAVAAEDILDQLKAEWAADEAK